MPAERGRGIERHSVDRVSLAETAVATPRTPCHWFTMETSELRRRLSEMELPACAALTPFTVEGVDAQAARVTVLFAAQPAFGNHLQQVQGGFAAAMIDTIVSLCGFAATERWLPTAALDLLFLSPVPLAPCYGTASMLKIGGKLCFADARLFDGDRIFVTAQATLANVGP